MSSALDGSLSSPPRSASTFCFHCPTCDAPYHVSEQQAGKKLSCQECGQRIQVPVPPGSLPQLHKTMLGKLAASKPPQKFPSPPGAISTPANALEIKIPQRVCDYCLGRLPLGALKCQHCGETVGKAPEGVAAVRRVRQPRRNPPVDLPSVSSTRNEVQSSQQVSVVVNQGQRSFPHRFHLLMTLLTCGLWLPVWLLAYLLS